MDEDDVKGASHVFKIHNNLTSMRKGLFSAETEEGTSSLNVLSNLRLFLITIDHLLNENREATVDGRFQRGHQGDQLFLRHSDMCSYI